LNPALTLQELLTQIQTQLAPPDQSFSTEDLEQIINQLQFGRIRASFYLRCCKTGAQAYLTSDCKFHQFQESRDRGLILIDVIIPERPAQLVAKFKALLGEIKSKDEDFRLLLQH